MRYLLTSGFLAAIACACAAQADEPKATGCDAMLGVWEYVAPSAPGHAIVARQGSKYVGIFVNTLRERDAEPAKPATAAERANDYSNSVAGAWEYSCEVVAGKLRLRLRWLYSSYQPQDVGTEATLEVEPVAGQATWWWIGADGKRGTMGAGRLIR